MPVPSQPINLVPKPFADNGGADNIPEVKPSAGRASFDDGFPNETQLPLNAGGIAPNRRDFNGILKILTAFQFWQQSGGQWTYLTTLNYTTPCVVYHENTMWWCVKENGPDSANGLVEPGTDEDYWIEYLQTLVGGSTSIGVPIGGMIDWPSTDIPGGFLWCNGQAFSATQYPELYAVLGTTTVPDTRGYFARGYDGTRAVKSLQNWGAPTGATRGIRDIGARGQYLQNNADGVFSINQTGSFVEGTGVGGPWSSCTNTIDWRIAGGLNMSNEIRPKNIDLLKIIRAI